MKNRRLILCFSGARQNKDGLRLKQNAIFKFVSRCFSFLWAFIPDTRNLTEIHVYGSTGLLSPSTLNLLKAAFITMFYCMLKLWSLHFKVSVDLAGHSCSSNWKDSKWTKSQEIKSNFCFRWVGRADLHREKLLWGQHKTNKLNVHTASRPKSPYLACTIGFVTTQRVRLFPPLACLTRFLETLMHNPLTPVVPALVRSHWWEVSAISTAPAMLPYAAFNSIKYNRRPQLEYDHESSNVGE